MIVILLLFTIKNSIYCDRLCVISDAISPSNLPNSKKKQIKKGFKSRVKYHFFNNIQLCVRKNYLLHRKTRENMQIRSIFYIQ